MAKRAEKENYGLFVNKETGTTYISRANANMPATVRRYDPKPEHIVNLNIKNNNLF